MPTKAKPKSKKRTTAKRTTKRAVAKKPSVKKLKTKILGKVVHFYDKINVAIVELASPLAVGDTVMFKRGKHEHKQTIRSMQIDHAGVAKAKKGAVVGVQVSKPVHDRSLVVAA